MTTELLAMLLVGMLLGALVWSTDFDRFFLEVGPLALLLVAWNFLPLPSKSGPLWPVIGWMYAPYAWLLPCGVWLPHALLPTDSVTNRFRRGAAIALAFLVLRTYPLIGQLGNPPPAVEFTTKDYVVVGLLVAALVCGVLWWERRQWLRSKASAELAKQKRAEQECSGRGPVVH